MTKKPKLTVIIPFYNEISFLSTAVQSITSQKVESIEILIVNDNPENFDDDFFLSYKFPENIRVIHHSKNKGLPSSRNSGIKEAKGRFIAFLDADDYYLPGGLKSHLAYAELMEADITHAQTVITHVNQTSGNIIAPDTAFHGKQFRGRFEKNEVARVGFFIESSWSSIYQRSFLIEKNVIFDETQVKFEDRIFVIEALSAANSLAILGEPCRVWRKRNNSITTSAKSRTDQILKLNLFKKSIDIWSKKGGPFSRHLAAQELVRQVSYMITKNETSPWYGCFGFSDTEEDRELSDSIADVLDSFQLEEEELILAYDARSPRYSEINTGGGKITPTDLYRFIQSVAEKNYDRSREIISQTVNRSREYVAPYMPKSQSEKNIILHFGLHKTGSTHIQHQLSENREVLKDHGILFPQTGLGFPEGRDPVRPNGLPGHQALVTSVFQDDLSILDQLRGEVLGSGCNTIIISAENLSQPDANIATRTRRIRRVVESLETIGRVSPIVLYRRPDRWFESYFRELAGNGAPVGYQKPGEFLVNNSRVLDFSAIIESIETACCSRAKLLSFDEMISSDRDLVFEFLDGCGLKIREHEFVLAEDTHYTSTCNAQLEIARLISVFVKDHESRQNILRTFYALETSTLQKSPLFSSRERREIIERFCDSADPIFLDRGMNSPRDTWLEKAIQGGEPETVSVPANFINSMWISGVMNGTSLRPAKLFSQDEDVNETDLSIAHISDNQLQSILYNSRGYDDAKRELDYMKNSVSWRVTKPLRQVMTLYKKLKSIS